MKPKDVVSMVLFMGFIDSMNQQFVEFGWPFLFPQKPSSGRAFHFVSPRSIEKKPLIPGGISQLACTPCVSNTSNVGATGICTFGALDLCEVDGVGRVVWGFGDRKDSFLGFGDVEKPAISGLRFNFPCEDIQN